MHDDCAGIACSSSLPTCWMPCRQACICAGRHPPLADQALERVKGVSGGDAGCACAAAIALCPLAVGRGIARRRVHYLLPHQHGAILVTSGGRAAGGAAVSGRRQAAVADGGREQAAAAARQRRAQQDCSHVHCRPAAHLRKGDERGHRGVAVGTPQHSGGAALAVDGRRRRVTGAQVAADDELGPADERTAHGAGWAAAGEAPAHPAAAGDRTASQHGVGQQQGLSHKRARAMCRAWSQRRRCEWRRRRPPLAARPPRCSFPSHRLSH
jgi:hypothetical protein